MAEINNNMNINLFMNLPPPGQIGEGYGNLAVDIHGNPIGDNSATKTLAVLLGYSDKDTIGSALDNVKNAAAQINIAFLITGSPDQAVQIYLNSLDPTQPLIPPIKELIILSYNNLKEGKIGNVELKFEVEAQATQKTDVKAKPEKNVGGFDYDTTYKGDFSTLTGDFQGVMDANFGKHDESSKAVDDELTKARNMNAGKPADGGDGIPLTPIKVPLVSIGNAVGGNLWFTGNAYVTFLTMFAELQRILMQNKVVQSKIDLIGMELTVELAKTTADLIMSIAHMNQLIHIVTAAMSGVSIVLGVGGLAAGFGGLRAGKTWALDVGTLVGQMGASVEKLSTASVQAATDIGIAEKEGLKEVMQAYRTIAQRQMEKAADAFKSQEDLIAQLIQTLDKIRDGLQNAIAGSLRK